MFLAHSFRLRDPWQCEAGEGGVVRWSRVFHRPTGMEPTDRLWLVASGLPDDATVWLNEQRLDASPPGTRGQFDVSELLADANRVVIACRGEVNDRFPFDVRLGIVGHE